MSGGPDSTALLHLVAAWRPLGLPVAVATVDHGLRPEARMEAEAVAAAAAALGLPAAVLRWEGDKPRRRLQERARMARYGLLAARARTLGASHIVTAHTSDDQAETLLMRLAAGSGPRGLVGMRPGSTWEDRIVARPFLGLRKAMLVALCWERGWPFVEDPANQDPRFARARWRRLAPALAEEGLTPERLGVLAARLARAERALEAATQAASLACLENPGDWRRFSAALWTQPDELALRLLAAALRDVAPEAAPRLGKLESLLDALREGRREGRPLRRTLQGCLVSLDRKGKLSVQPEEPRRSAAPPPVTPKISVPLNAKG